MNKRGISFLIGTLLLVLITLVALVIFYIGYKTLINKSEEGTSLDCATVNLKAQECLFFFNETNITTGDSLNSPTLFVTLKRNIGEGKINSIKILANTVGVVGGSLTYRTYFLEPESISNKAADIDNYFGNLVELTTEKAVNVNGIPLNTAVLDANVVAVAGDNVCAEKNKPIECSCWGPKPFGLGYADGSKTCRQEFAALGL